ncbi:MAG: dienelactone hydrolase family protein [Pseudonocardiaceae bacterium]
MTGSSPQQIPLSQGSEFRFTAAEPESVILGGIVVFHETRGVTTAVRQLAEGLAREGWLVVIPHLYHRSTADELPDDAARHLERLSAAAVLTDTDAALCWLTARGVTADRTGLVGFGLGGTVALIVATRRDVGAAVTVAGIGVMAPVSPALPALVEVAPELRCPWLGVYGVDDLPLDEVNKLQHAVSSAQVATDLVHFTDRRADQATTVEAWTRTLNWFDSHLR